MLDTPAKGVPQSVPILGTIAAGAPLLAEQNIEDYITLPARLQPINFALHVRGDTMIDAGIPSGVIVFCQSAVSAEHNAIAACLIDDEEATLKRFKRHDELLVYILKTRR